MTLCSVAIAAGVIGVVAVLKGLFFRRRFGGRGPWSYAACGPAFGGPGFGGHGCGDGHEGHGYSRGWRGRGRGPGGSFWLRAVFSRLDTTPGQEREIRGAIEEFQKTAYEAKDGLKGAREDLARAIRGASFDEIAASEASQRADAASAKIKDALTESLKRVHGVLDSTQRERLAELLAKGPGFGRRGWGDPYRDGAF